MSEHKYAIAVLADPHGGAFDANQWYMEYKKGFLKHLESMEKLDVVFIAGDLFDDKISANSAHAKTVMKFITKLIKLCNSKNAKLRIIKGTESHDNKQLELLESLKNLTDCDFRLIYTVEAEQMFDDFNILYIPEEYMESKTEYYKDYYISEGYDLIIGHGLVDKAIWFAEKQESETTNPKAPIFSLEELMMMCKGPVYFGHIHKPMTIDRFRYVGSYSRWAFGEQEEKGFFETHLTPKENKFKERFVINKHARQFDTVRVKYPAVLSKDNEKAQMEYLLEMVNNLKIDFIRLEVDIPEEHPKPMFITNMINELFARRKDVKLKINNNSKLRQKKETDEKIKTILDKYEFIFDRHMTPGEKVSKFIEVKMGKTILPERVDFYLTNNSHLDRKTTSEKGE